MTDIKALATEQVLRQNAERALEIEQGYHDETRRKLVAEQAAHQRTKDEAGRAEMMVDAERNAHEETKRQLAEARQGHCKEHGVVCSAHYRDLEATLKAVEEERGTALRELAEAEAARDAAYLDGVKSVTFIRCVRHCNLPQQNANEVDGSECGGCIVEGSQGYVDVKVAQELLTLKDARDAALRDNTELADTAANARLRVETLREALQAVARSPQMNCIYEMNSGERGHPVVCDCVGDMVRKALATTPTTGFVEKVRALAGEAQRTVETLERMGRDFIGFMGGPSTKERLRGALAAFYTEAPWLKP